MNEDMAENIVRLMKCKNTLYLKNGSGNDFSKMISLTYQNGEK